MNPLPPLTPLSPKDLAESKANMKRLVRAQMTGGWAALQKELDLLFPGTKAKELREEPSSKPEDQLDLPSNAPGDSMKPLPQLSPQDFAESKMPLPKRPDRGHSLEPDPEAIMHYVQTLVERWNSTMKQYGDQKTRRIFLAARRAGLGDRQIMTHTWIEIREAFFEAEKKLFGSVTPLREVEEESPQNR